MIVEVVVELVVVVVVLAAIINHCGGRGTDERDRKKNSNSNKGVKLAQSLFITR